MNVFQAILQRTALTTDQAELGPPLLRVLWRVLLSTNLILLTESLLDVRLANPTVPIDAFASEFIRMGLFAAILAGSFWSRGLAVFAGAACLLSLSELWRLVPSGPNHGYLGYLSTCISSLGILLSRNRPLNEEDSTTGSGGACWSAIYAVRWLVVYVMLWSGLNKLLYATYFQGEFFASMVHKDPRFAKFFTWIVPAAELQQIVDAENGPHRFRSLLPILGANVVYLSEIAAGLLLLFRHTASAGVLLTFAILVGIEIAAVELVFGGLMVNLLLIYFPRWYVHRGYWFSVAINGLLLGYLQGRLFDLLPDLGIH